MTATFLEGLADTLQERQGLVNDWYQHRLGFKPPILYSSIDIRNAGFKISVVDTNLFPSGFNNLCETFSENATRRFQLYFRTYYKGTRKVLILPEDHTRNDYYWKHVSALVQILRRAGLEVEIASARLEVSPKGLEVKKLTLTNGRLQAEGFDPDLILINNDLTTGTPDYLKDLSQTVLPSPRLGWHSRRKSRHFQIYHLLITEVSSLLGIDPWLLSALSNVETGIDLDDEICLQRLAASADHLLASVRQKYREQGLAQEPYLFVKNNAGTYGMGILHVHSGEELVHLGRRKRNKLATAKGGGGVSEFLLQEGMPTIDRHGRHGGKPMEPVVYCVGGEAVGSFFRVHTDKDEFESLNAPGMIFSCLCLHKIDEPARIEALFETGALLGRIASLAANLEGE